MNKTQEIKKKLQNGITPVELIKQGYKHGLVYKTNKELKTAISEKSDSATIQPPNQVALVDNDLDNDPEIIQLTKDIRKAELKKKLEGMVVSQETSPQIKILEKKIAESKKAKPYHGLAFYFGSRIQIIPVIFKYFFNVIYCRLKGWHTLIFPHLSGTCVIGCQCELHITLEII